MQPRFKAPIKGATAAPPLSSIASWQSRKAPSATAGKHFFPFQQHTSIVRCIYTIFFFAVFFIYNSLSGLSPCGYSPSMSCSWLLVVLSAFCVERICQKCGKRNCGNCQVKCLWYSLVSFEKCFMSAQWGSIIYKETTNERVIPNLKRHVQHRVLKS